MESPLALIFQLHFIKTGQLVSKMFTSAFGSERGWSGFINGVSKKEFSSFATQRDADSSLSLHAGSIQLSSIESLINSQWIQIERHIYSTDVKVAQTEHRSTPH